MNRTALRLATLAALTNGGEADEDGNWPTLADDYVYDSRRDMINDVQERLRRPVIVIRTDDDRRRQPDNSRLQLRERAVSLVLEISVVTARKEEDNWILSWPQTDPALEAILDMLEYQIENALFGLKPWSRWWRNFKWTRLDWLSTPEFTRDPHMIRLAARNIVITLNMPPDCLPGYKLDSEEAIEGQPPPLLKRVLEQLDAEAAGDLLTAMQEIRQVLDARTWPTVTSFPQLLRVRSGIDIEEIRLDASLRKGETEAANFSRDSNSMYLPLLFEDI